jgi:hypothetical protein
MAGLALYFDIANETDLDTNRSNNFLYSDYWVIKKNLKIMFTGSDTPRS